MANPAASSESPTAPIAVRESVLLKLRGDCDAHGNEWAFALRISFGIGQKVSAV
jgi:hypothetical protein